MWRITATNLNIAGGMTQRRFRFVRSQLRLRGLNDDEISVIMSLLTIDDICVGIQWIYEMDETGRATLTEHDAFNLM